MDSSNEPGVATLSTPWRAEEVERETEGRFRQLTEALPQLIWSCTPDGQADYFSRQWIEYTGVPAEPQLGNGWLEQLHPDDRERTYTACRQAVENGAACDVEHRVRRRDSDYRWFELRVAPLRDATGQIIRWVGSNVDIEDRKQAEITRERLLEDVQAQNEELQAQSAEIQAQNEELRAADEETQRLLAEVQQEKDKLSALVNSITDEVWLTDTEKRFTLANPAAVREFGPAAEGLEVEKLAASLEVLRPDGSPRPLEEAPPLRALRGEVVKSQEEIVRTPTSRGLRHRQVSAAPIRDAGGNIVGAVSVVRDITERKQAEEIVRRQAQEILDLSTPVVQVLEGVVAVPLIGTLDSRRTQQVTEQLLNGIVETRSSVALLDITGVPAIDTETARHLIETISAVRLLGAQVILTGIRPSIAQTLVHLGVILADVVTRSSLSAGLRVALDILNLKIVSKDQG